METQTSQVIGNALRKGSEEPDLPWQFKNVCWMLVAPDGVVSNPSRAADRDTALRLAREGKAKLYIAWPGRWRTDLFEMDNVATLVKE